MQRLEKMRDEVNETLQYFVDYCQQYGMPQKVILPLALIR